MLDKTTTYDEILITYRDNGRITAAQMEYLLTNPQLAISRLLEDWHNGQRLARERGETIDVYIHKLRNAQDQVRQSHLDRLAMVDSITSAAEIHRKVLGLLEPLRAIADHAKWCRVSDNLGCPDHAKMQKLATALADYLGEDVDA